MARQPLFSPSITPVASPVDRYVSPALEQPDSGLVNLAQSLSSVNPQIQSILGEMNNRNAQAEQAAGANAALYTDPEEGLRANKEGWQSIIDQVRKRDREMGTNHAEELVGASPHFRRGLVGAKARRIGMGLQTYLQQKWQANEGGVRGLDDPQAITQWTQEQTQAYSEQMGIEGIDPVIINEQFTPLAERAMTNIVNNQMTYRSKARVQEYTNEFSAGVGLIMNGAGGASSVDDFIARLTGSESSGDSTASRTNQDGRTFTGLLQFGKARLDDYNAANGTDITQSKFVKDDALQRRVGRWHINDIDEHIRSKGYLEMGYSLDGLRAVAHLGGTGGMDKFVATGGNYNPTDELGTSLGDYYQKFASTAGALQQQIDTAIGNGMAPTDANETLVDSVVAEAKASRDGNLLAVLQQVSTGNGPLGNIGWVKEKVVEAQEWISDQAWEEETRSHTLEQRERADLNRRLKISGFREVMSDPTADHSEMIGAIRDAGFPDLANSVHDLQQKLLNEEQNVTTDHTEVMRLRSMIHEEGADDLAIMDEIRQGVTQGRFSSTTAMSLVDDLEKGASGEFDMIRDSDVQDIISTASTLVRERTHIEDSILGNVIQNGREFSWRFENEIRDELEIFISENPNATKAQLRKFTRDTVRSTLRQPDYQPQQDGQGGVTTTQTNTQLDSVSSDRRPSRQDTSAASPVEGYTEEQLRQGFARWQQSNPDANLSYEDWLTAIQDQQQQ